jgi:hypothetical protein
MQTASSHAPFPLIVLGCGLFPWVVVPVAAFVVAGLAPAALGATLVIVGTAGLGCGLFAALRGRPAADSGPAPWPQRVGHALGVAYVLMLVVSLLLGAIGGLLSPWLEEIAAA